MKQLYNTILDKALPYYQRGRFGDVEHIKWLVETVPKYVDESEADFDILMPLVILHDIGYCKVDHTDPINLDIRRAHMREGAKIAKEILQEVHYPKENAKEIVRLVAKHDNWAFGESFEDEPVLQIFSNFDFLWMLSEKGFDIVRTFTKQTPKEFIEQIKEYQRKNEEEGRGWCNKRVQKLYETLSKKSESNNFYLK